MGRNDTGMDSNGRSTSPRFPPTPAAPPHSKDNRDTKGNKDTNPTITPKVVALGLVVMPLRFSPHRKLNSSLTLVGIHPLRILPPRIHQQRLQTPPRFSPVTKVDSLHLGHTREAMPPPDRPQHPEGTPPQEPAVLMEATIRPRWQVRGKAHRVGTISHPTGGMGKPNLRVVTLVAANRPMRHPRVTPPIILMVHRGLGLKGNLIRARGSRKSASSSPWVLWLLR